MKNDILKHFFDGEWVDCDLVEKALDIDFATGLRMFDFSRTAEWNKHPQNGQKITTKFRLKNVVTHGHWIERFDGRYGQRRTYCSVCNKHSGIGGNKQEPPFCPNCGAKMDGDSK